MLTDNCHTTPVSKIVKLFKEIIFETELKLSESVLEKE